MNIKKEFATINNATSGMFTIEHNNPEENPVILYIHGGPGLPKFSSLMVSGAADLMGDEFTVCLPDQRGAGLSNTKDLDFSTVTLDQIVDDMAEIARSLIKKYKKEKIYLFGHSWGSVVGLHLAKKFPELFYAYIGAGFAGSQETAELITYNYFIQQASQEGDNHLLSQLNQFDILDNGLKTLEWLKIRNDCLDRWNVGSSYLDKNATEKTNAFTESTDYYTSLEKEQLKTGVIRSLTKLWPFFVTNGNTDIEDISIPLIVFQGLHDFQTATPEAIFKYKNLKAPMKKLVLFDKSAHSMMYDEPQKFVSELKAIALN